MRDVCAHRKSIYAEINTSLHLYFFKLNNPWEGMGWVIAVIFNGANSSDIDNRDFLPMGLLIK
ncbi:MAG: hypothetical protein EGP80_14390 [Blautia wexlerae]|nr:hypothetical protein [Blautia wexlerae]